MILICACKRSSKEALIEYGNQELEESDAVFVSFMRLDRTLNDSCDGLT
jgi:hypothetical protein